MLSGEATNTNFIVFVIWPDQGSNPRSTTLEVSMPTITPPIRLLTEEMIKMWNIKYKNRQQTQIVGKKYNNLKKYK